MAHLTPISGDYAIPKGLIYWQAEGSDTMVELGDADAVEISIEVEEQERYSNQFGTRTLADSQVTQVSAELSMTLLQMTSLNRALALMGTKAWMNQSSAPAQTYTITGVQAGGIYELPHLDVTVSEVTDGAATVTYDEGTHYEVDAEAGLLRVISIPGSADTDAVIAYDAAAIDGTSERLQVTIGANSNIRGKIVIRGTNDVGARVMVELPIVQIRPSGSRSYISESDYGSVELTGKIIRHPSIGLGVERTLR